MIPSTEQVMLSRHRVMQWLRLTELLLFILGTMPLVFGIVESQWRWDAWSLSRFSGYIATSAMFWLPGLLMLFLDRRLIKWIVPLAKLACPQCGQLLVHLAEPRCPECGCPIPESLVDRSSTVTQ